MFSEMLNNDVERKLKVIPIDDSIYKLVFAVEKATREFMSKTGKTPTKLIVNDIDFDISKIDKVLKDTLVKNWELTEEKYKLQEQYNSALKTNENLVEYKNDLLRENATLVEKLFTYTTMSFWKRLVFLFTGKVS